MKKFKGRKSTRVILYITFVSPFCPPKIDMALKSPLDQNSIVIYHKFNSNFKSHINLKTKKKTRVICSVTLPYYMHS
jgi:hypothetical protein